MTEGLFTQLSVVDVAAGQPGVLDLVLEEHLRCPRCRLTSATWQIPLDTPGSPPAPPAAPDLPRRVPRTNLGAGDDLAEPGQPPILPDLPDRHPTADPDGDVYRHHDHGPGGHEPGS